MAQISFHPSQKINLTEQTTLMECEALSVCLTLIAVSFVEAWIIYTSGDMEVYIIYG